MCVRGWGQPSTALPFIAAERKLSIWKFPWRVPSPGETDGHSTGSLQVTPKAAMSPTENVVLGSGNSLQE